MADWKAGDVISLHLPQPLHLEPTPDDPNLVAVLRGPIVLAGTLGTAGMPADTVLFALKNNAWQPPTNDIPTLVGSHRTLDWLQPVAGRAGTYLTRQAGRLGGQAKEVTFVPFYQVHHQRYALYWKLFSPVELAKRADTVSDEVDPAQPDSEQAHGLQGEKTEATVNKDPRDFWEKNRPCRVATDGGWFSYDLKTNPQAPRQFLVVTYWGSAPRTARFEVLVNGQIIKSEDLHNRHPLTLYDEVYELPANLLSGKKTATIRFQSDPGTSAGPVFGLKLTSDPAAFPGYSFY